MADSPEAKAAAITALPRATQGQSASLSAADRRTERRSDDGQTILEQMISRTRCCALTWYFWVGAAGFEPATPRL
jgi:hypothetical protein